MFQGQALPIKNSILFSHHLSHNVSPKTLSYQFQTLNKITGIKISIIKESTTTPLAS